MDLIIKPARLAFVFCVGAIIFVGCSSKTEQQTKRPGWDSERAPTPSTPLRTRQARTPTPQYDIPIVQNASVQRWKDYFTGRGERWFRVWMERSGRYIPFMQEILREHGMPEDLVYLSMIESGFSSRAYSRARAVGLWQFMVATGRIYNLKVNFWVDERRDPEKATVAAARHLRDLYDQYQDWYLAFSAYNAGQGRISRGMRRAQADNFWDLAATTHIPRETRNYVPKLIAATIIAKNPEKYGFTGIEKMPILEYDKVIIRKPVNLQALAKRAGYPLEELLRLNPELNYPVTPPDVREYELRVPSRSSDKFLMAFNNMQPEEFFQYASHRVQRGETISAIANRYRTSTSEIMRLNNIRSARSLQIGQNLLLPIPDGVDLPAPVHRHVAGPRRVADNSGFYTVRRGDNLWSISRSFRVSIPAIRSTNSLRSDTLRPGQRLRIPGQGGTPQQQVATRQPAGQSAVHIVRRGETLSAISQRYRVSIAQIRSANNLRGDRIQIGQRLQIPGGAASASAPQQRSEPQVHVVRRGDNLWTISRRYGVSIDQIRNANRIRGDNIRIGQRLQIPASGTAGGSQRTVENRVHVVRRGESLWTISRRYSTSINQIKQINNLQQSTIFPGKRLVIPGSSS